MSARGSLEQLRKQAKELLRALRAGDPGAAERFRRHRQKPAEPVLADAQFVLAREHGFPSWPRLKRHFEIVQRPADFFEPTWGRDTWPMMAAVYDGANDAAREMLARNPKLVRAQYAYLEPLHYAVMGGHADTVALLLESGGSPVAEGWSGRPLGDDSPVARARDRERDDLVKLLEEAARRSHEPTREPHASPLDSLGELEKEMSGYGHRGDLAGAREFLRAHPDLAYAGLYEAAHHGHTEVVRLLLDHGADPARPWRWACWFTPLMHSLRYEEPRWEIAELLLGHGVSPNDRSGMGIGVLNMIAAMGTVRAAEWLLDRGADIHLRDYQFDSTPLAWAARCGREEMVQFLLSRGALPVHPDDDPWATPAAWARRKGHRALAALLTP